MGPYESEADAHAEPLPQELHRMHEANLIKSGDPLRLAHNTIAGHLFGACRDAGVDLGAYDRRILGWLCGWEPETAQVVIGVITRANTDGRN